MVFTGWECSSVEEYLLSICEILGSIPSTVEEEVVGAEHLNCRKEPEKGLETSQKGCVLHDGCCCNWAVGVFAVCLVPLGPVCSCTWQPLLAPHCCLPAPRPLMFLGPRIP